MRTSLASGIPSLRRTPLQTSSAPRTHLSAGLSQARRSGSSLVVVPTASSTFTTGSRVCSMFCSSHWISTRHVGTSAPIELSRDCSHPWPHTAVRYPSRFGTLPMVCVWDLGRGGLPYWLEHPNMNLRDGMSSVPQHRPHQVPSTCLEITGSGSKLLMLSSSGMLCVWHFSHLAAEECSNTCWPSGERVGRVGFDP